MDKLELAALVLVCMTFMATVAVITGHDGVVITTLMATLSAVFGALVGIEIQKKATVASPAMAHGVLGHSVIPDEEPLEES